VAFAAPDVVLCYRFRAVRLDYWSMSEQTTERTCHKTYKEKLRPTPAQERALERVLRRCRVLYNTALEQRITAWQRCHVSLTRSQQEAELKEIRAEFPEYAALHSHVLQDVLARLDTTYQAFFRRLMNGEQPGFPRFQGRDRYHSFTDKEYGNGARLDNGSLVLPTGYPADWLSCRLAIPTGTSSPRAGVAAVQLPIGVAMIRLARR
jgi:hypothetical protein